MIGSVISIASTIGSLFGGSSSGKGDAEAELAALKRKQKKQAESEVKAKAFIEKYKKGMKSAKHFKHEKKGLVDWHKNTTSILDKYNHRTKQKSDFMISRILKDNEKAMAGLNPRSQGMVIDQLESKFKLSDQSVQEESTMGPTLKV